MTNLFIQIFGIIPQLDLEFSGKKKKIRKHNPWIKVKAYLNLISDFGIFPPRGTVLLLSPDI